MPITFPSNPSQNQTYTAGGKTWTYNGKGWVLSPAIGATGQAANVLVSSSPPVTADPGDLWLDDETGKLRIYYGGGWAGAAVGPIGATGATGAAGAITAYVFDGGTPSSTYTQGPAFDCGGVT